MQSCIQNSTHENKATEAKHPTSCEASMWLAGQVSWKLLS